MCRELRTETEGEEHKKDVMMDRRNKQIPCLEKLYLIRKLFNDALTISEVI